MSEDAIYKAAALKVVISACEYFASTLNIHPALFFNFSTKATSLAVMLLDFGLLMHDEVKYIWS